MEWKKEEKKVINHRGEELRIGDTIEIISETIESGKSLGTVTIGEIVTITGFSDNGRIMYHHSVLALPVHSNVYKLIR